MKDFYNNILNKGVHIYKRILKHNTFVLFYVLLVFGLSLFTRNVRAVTYFDDGIYLVVSKSISEAKGYRLISHPQKPEFTKYPPGYPVLLSLLWCLDPKFPDNLITMKTINSIFFGLGLFVFWIYATNCKYGSKQEVFFAILIASVSPIFFRFSTMLMSEMFYFLLSVTTLFSLEYYLRKKGYSAMMVASLMCGACYYIRSIGGILFFVFSVCLIAKRKFKQMTFFSLCSLVILLPWNYYILMVGEKSINYYQDFFLGSSSVTENIKSLSLEGIPNVIFSLPFISHTIRTYIDKYNLTFLRDIVSSCILGIIILGTVRENKGIFTKPFHVYVATYLGVLLLWPYNDPHRFLVPIVPFICLTFCRGLFRIHHFLFKKKNLIFVQIGIWGLCGGFFIASLLMVVRTIPYIIQNGGINAEENMKNYAKDKVFAWIRNNTENDEVLAGSVGQEVYLYTGRKCIARLPIVDCLNEDGSFRSFRKKVILYSIRYFVNLGYSERKIKKLLNTEKIEYIYKSHLDNIAIIKLNID